MDKTKVQAAFVAAGLSQRVRDIDTLARPSIRLFTTPVEESSLQVGVSKLGGLPDLPAGTQWPEWNGLPQSFIAQIRLDDLHSYDVQGVLPRYGMLWFFYDAQQQTFGENPADAGGWRSGTRVARDCRVRCDPSTALRKRLRIGRGGKSGFDRFPVFLSLLLRL